MDKSTKAYNNKMELMRELMAKRVVLALQQCQELAKEDVEMARVEAVMCLVIFIGELGYMEIVDEYNKVLEISSFNKS